MPISFDNTPDYMLHSLFRSELDFLGRLPFWAPAVVAATVALAVAAMLMLGRLRSQEEVLGQLRREKAEVKGRQGEAAVMVVLARAGFPALHDVILRDAWGLTQVDHLVRLADGIAVLETKAFAGTVTGHMGDRHWVQELRGGRVRAAFRNPVMQNERHVRAVRRVAGYGVPVCGLVVSAGTARFCGELKGTVVGLDGLAARLHAGPAVACDVRRLDAAWRALTAAAARSGTLRGAPSAGAAGTAACWCGLRGSEAGSVCPVRSLPAARRPVAAGLLLLLLTGFLAWPRRGSRPKACALAGPGCAGRGPLGACARGGAALSVGGVPEPRAGAAPVWGGLDPRRGQATLVVCQAPAWSRGHPAGPVPPGAWRGQARVAGSWTRRPA